MTTKKKALFLLEVPRLPLILNFREKEETEIFISEWIAVVGSLSVGGGR
jgi:hypothetical protein